MKWWRVIVAVVRTLKLATAIVVLALMAAYLALHTTPGKQWLAHRIYTLSGGIVELKGLSGTLPFHLTARELSIRDDHHDIWLSARSISASLSVRAFVHGEIHVQQLRVGQLTWIDLPDYTSGSTSRTSETQAARERPIKNLRVDAIAIDAYDIHDHVAGLAFSGSLRATLAMSLEDYALTSTLASDAVIAARIPARVEGTLAYRDAALLLPDIIVRDPHGTIATAAGKFEFSGGSASITGTLHAVDTVGYREVSGWPLDGPVHLAWTINRPQRGAAWEFGLDGTINQLSEEPLSAGITINRSRLSALRLNLSAMNLEPWTPMIAGSANVQIDLHHLDTTPSGSASITVDEARFSSGLLDHFDGAELALQLTMEDHAVSAQSVILHPLLNQFIITSRITTAPRDGFIPRQLCTEGGLTARLQVNGNLKELSESLITSATAVGGELQIDLSANIRPGPVHLTGEIAWRNGQFRHLHTGSFLDRIQVVLRGDGQRLVIASAQAHDGGRGLVNAEGAIDFADLHQPAWSLRLDLTNATLFRVIRTELPLSGHVSAVGDPDGSRIAGELTLEPFRFTIPRRLPPSVRTLEVTEINHPDPARNTPSIAAVERAGTTARPSHPVALDIAVRTRRSFEVRGRGLQSEWRGTMKLSGTGHQPQLTGSAQIIRGHAMLLGRRFTLDEGRIELSGALPPRPQINVTASTRIGEIMARLIVSGSTDRPSIRLVSDPLLPEDEIMAMVLFGKLLDTMTPWQAIALANGLRILGGGESDLVSVMESGQSLLRVDQIDIRQDEEGEGFASISVGKHLGSRMYVEGEKGFGEAEDVVKVTLELRRGLVIETETSPRIREGIGLFWRRDL